MNVIEVKILQNHGEKNELILEPLLALLFRSLTSNAEFEYGKPNLILSIS